MTNKEIQKVLENLGYDDVVLFDNFDYADAFIGVTVDNRAVYDFEKMIESLQNQMTMTYEDAVEFIEFNTIRSLPYLGDKAPIILNRLEEVIKWDLMN